MNERFVVVLPATSLGSGSYNVHVWGVIVYVSIDHLKNVASSGWSMIFLDLVTRFRVCEWARLKQACLARETS